MNRNERILLREKSIVAVALTIVFVGSWLYLVADAGNGMSAVATASWKMMLGLSHSMSGDWTLQYAWVVFVMWWIMLIGMMLSSAAPMISDPRTDHSKIC